MSSTRSRNDETSPLLHRESHDRDSDKELLELPEDDKEHPRAWSRWSKAGNVAVIALMAVLSPLASSMFAPGIEQIAESLHTTETAVIGCQTGFVVMLGIGPLVLAPMSETFGRKIVYLVCFSIFTLLQIPTALSANLGMLITLRTVGGFFGSVSIANGGGTISDMYEPSERSSIMGWYLLGVLLGPTIGPLLGGIILQYLDWPWLFWILTIMSGTIVAVGFLCLQETHVPTLLSQRKKEIEKEEDAPGKYYFEGEDDRPMAQKLSQAVTRPVRILLTQPIVFVMSTYQALLFATTYSLYTQFETIYGKDYGFSTLQVGLLYLFPGAGFLLAVRLLVPRIDTVFNALTRRNNGESKPEFRLPLANIGAVLIPLSLFWFAWTTEYHVHWAASITSTFFYGIGQVVIFNATQNYYIDAFEKYAASAIAAGALFRSLVGGVVPLITPSILDRVGYGWGFSIFAFVGVILAPSPLLFYRYGERVRQKFAIEL